MITKRSAAAWLKPDALKPRLRRAALIYVVSLAAALGEALTAGETLLSGLFPTARPPAATPTQARAAAQPVAVNGRKTRAGLNAERARPATASTDGQRADGAAAIRTGPSPAHRLMAGVRHELAEAREPRSTAPPVRRDSRGRRLRSSAYIYGPHGPRDPRRRRGRRVPGVATSMLPAGVKIVLVLVVAAGAFLGSSQAYINYAADLPDAHAITAEPLPEDTLVYASDGTLLADLHQEGLQHYYEPLDRMGKYLPQATIAIEDSNFWNEPGIDIGAMVRAAWIDWREKKPVQGASTITQQLVKMRLIGNQPSIDRKIKEAILAVQVEHTYSKRQILEQYMNTVPYSNNAQGTLAAARIYFHKETKDLDLAQAAMLAGIPQSPFYNSPLIHPDVAKQRQRGVLGAMVKQKLITQDEADQAYAEDVSAPEHVFTSAAPELRAAEPNWVARNFTSWIRDQLKARYGEKATLGGGLRVMTTINLALQAGAEATIASGVRDNRFRNVSSGAMVAMDPRTGAVLAMVGGDPGNPDEKGGQYNLAVWPPRNPGSSMKIYTYTAGIETGKFTMNTTIYDTPISIDQVGGPPYQPKNYDLKYHGQCTFQQCIGNSLNVPAVKVEAATGVDKVVDTARRMGAPPWQNHGSDGKPDWVSDDPAQNFGYSLTLGGYGETPLQMAAGASVLGAQGVYHPPFGIASIKSAEGTEILKVDPGKTAKQAVDPKAAFIMEQVMSDNDNRQMIFQSLSTNLVLNGRRAGAKTGTTENFTDAWTVGYTPSLAAAFWFGNANSAALTQGSDGIYVAAPAWKGFMQGALDALKAPPSEWFSEPPGLGHAQVSGKTVYLMPGTNANQPAPPLPPGVHSSGPPPPCPPPDSQNNPGNQGGNNKPNCSPQPSPQPSPPAR